MHVESGSRFRVGKEGWWVLEGQGWEGTTAQPFLPSRLEWDKLDMGIKDICFCSLVPSVALHMGLLGLGFC